MSTIESAKAQRPPASDDLVWGTQAIADEIGQPLDRTRYLIRTKRIPVTKLGGKTIIASRKKLRRALQITTD